jgi:hypothetical protein
MYNEINYPTFVFSLMCKIYEVYNAVSDQLFRKTENKPL